MPVKSTRELIKSNRSDSLNESLSTNPTENVTVNPPPTIISGITIAPPVQATSTVGNPGMGSGAQEGQQIAQE
ncbi:MAG: hypothetical protein ABUK01_11320 [Leptospirales bacterium]